MTELDRQKQYEETNIQAIEGLLLLLLAGMLTAQMKLLKDSMKLGITLLLIDIMRGNQS
jgi:hypothetical protein